jgi:hypothetical protein
MLQSGIVVCPTLQVKGETEQMVITWSGLLIESFYAIGHAHIKMAL